MENDGKVLSEDEVDEKNKLKWSVESKTRYRLMCEPSIAQKVSQVQRHEPAGS